MGAGGGVAERPAEPAQQSEPARPVEPESPSPTPPPRRPAPTPTAPPRTARATRDAEAVFDAPPTREFEAFSAGAGLASSLKDARRSAAAAEDVGAQEAVQDARPEAGQELGAEAGAADGSGRVARVKEHTRARVGRIREEALVVLEEAPDDSGMRFVVLAVLAFVLFVVVLFLSTTVLR